MIPLPLLLSRVNWRRALGLGACATIIVLVLLVRMQEIALKQAEVAYKNPRAVQTVKVVKVQGPVRIVTKVVKTADREETTREEVRGPVFETMDEAFLVEPVFPPAPRSDRWLAGAAFQPFHSREPGAWTAYAGYSFKNRLDLCGGITGRGRPSVLVMVRF